jgi:hypothetical protein
VARAASLERRKDLEHTGKHRRASPIGPGDYSTASGAERAARLAVHFHGESQRKSGQLDAGRFLVVSQGFSPCDFLYVGKQRRQGVGAAAQVVSVLRIAV